MKETTHRRDLLRVEQLEEFATFCRAHGFQRRAPKGPHEVLRMFRDQVNPRKRTWLLVHKRDYTLAGSTNVQHVTVWGESERMAKAFFRERRLGRAGNLPQQAREGEW